MLLPGTGGHGTAGVCVHHTTHLPRTDVRVRRGLPVTSPARMMLDLASIAGDRELERALDEALVQRIVRIAEIEEVLGRSSGRRRSTRLASLIRERTTTTVTRSEAEERFLELIRLAELPIPRMNVLIEGFEVDCVWPAQRVVVEIDGYRYHSSRTAFERDHHRDAILRSRGWLTIRITWRQLESEPYAVIALIAQALGA